MTEAEAKQVALEDFFSANTTKETLTDIIHGALKTLKVKVWNGSLEPIELCLPEAFLVLSGEVRKTKLSIEENTSQTTENTRLLSGAKGRSDLWSSFSNVFDKLDKAFKIRMLKNALEKILMIAGIGFTLYHIVLVLMNK